MRKANYKFYAENEKARTIVDVGPWNVYPTITNAAERTVKDEYENGLGERKLFYFDSEGELTELVHDGRGNFIDFKMV